MRSLYCDESVWDPVADGLKQRGWEVHTVVDEETRGDGDRQQLRYARENDWLLVTFDDDFLSLVEGQGLDHTGIIYIDQRGKRIGEVVKQVDTYLDGREELSYRIHYP